MSGFDLPTPAPQPGPSEFDGPPFGASEVSIDQPLAGWSQRAGAFLLDGLAALVAAAVGYAIAAALVAGGAAAAGVIFGLAVYLLGPLAGFVFYAWQMCRPGDRNGQTIGKRALHIRVVRADGRPVSLGTVLLRHALIGAFYLVTFLIGVVVDYLWPLWDERNQSLHDKLAKTYVVRADAAVAAAAHPLADDRPSPLATVADRGPYRAFDQSAPAARAVRRYDRPPAAPTAPPPAGAARGRGPWILAGCLVLALAIAAVSFTLASNQASRKLADAVNHASAASTAESSTAASTTTDGTAATSDASATTSASAGTVTDAANGRPAGSVPSAPSSSYPILADVTGEILVRSGPGTNASVVGTLAAGGSVTITCQSQGETVNRPGGKTTDVWDHLAQPAGYVTDTVIDTGASGNVAPTCTAAETAQAAAGTANAVPGGAGPARILRRHFQLLNRRDYQGAFALFAARYRASAPGWVANRQTGDPTINVITVGQPSFAPGGADVPIVFYARDRNPASGSDTLCHRFTGSAHMSSDGSWFYEPMGNRLTDTVAPSDPNCQ